MLAITFFGIGLLPLSPLLALISSIFLRIRLKKSCDRNTITRGNLWKGVAATLVVLLALEIPTLISYTGITMAMAEKPNTRKNGITLLRALGSEENLLRFCYDRARISTGLAGFLLGQSRNTIHSAEVAKIFYQVTGESHTSRERVVPNGRDFNFDFDTHLGSDTVAGVLPDLFLSSSNLQGSLDADAALAYLEWTMVFSNRSNRQQEARAQILLPSGGCVSRLTLWVDGEEREAAFGGRSRVKAAYAKVVAKRRDPVLVTSAGPDRIMVQCFPVPPGKEMKIRLGITTPLQINSRKSGTLLLPRFLEKNFTPAEGKLHYINISSKQPLSTHRGELRSIKQSAPFILKGKVSDTALSQQGIGAEHTHNMGLTTSWANHQLLPQNQVVTQTISERGMTAPERLIIIMDGSRAMAKKKAAIIRALDKLPINIELIFLIAGDHTVELTSGFDRLDSESLQRLQNKIESYPFQGGCDNVPPLLQALELVEQSEEQTQVLWLHGPQPILLSPITPLEIIAARLREPSTLLSFSTDNGPDRVLERIGHTALLTTFSRLSTVEQDLQRLFSYWQGTSAPFFLQRSLITQDQLSNSYQKSSDHLVRLWAHNQAIRLQQGTTADREAGKEIAIKYQLVTPLTGAVVLETAQQFNEAGLEPVDASSVPTIPEPATILLLIIGFLTLVTTRYRRIEA